MVTALGEQGSGKLRSEVAEEVRVLLARRKLSAVKLAQQLGMSQGYLSRRLNAVQPFDMDDLERIADALGVPVSVFFGDGPKSGQATAPNSALLDGDFDPTPPDTYLSVIAA
jgi:transcriptional regulator with XRE-family HTH domain